MRSGSVASSSSKPPSTSRPTKPSSSTQTSGTKRQRVETVYEEDERSMKHTSAKGKERANPIDISNEHDAHHSHARENGLEAKEESVGSLRRRMEKLEKQLDEALQSRDSYHDQLQSLFAKRETVAEEAGRKINEVWEERNKIQEAIIEELRQQVDENDENEPDQKSKATIVQLEGENERLRSELSRARELVEEGKRGKHKVVELEQQVARLKKELHQETIRTNAARTMPSSSTKPSSSLSEDSTIKFYEELTHVSVMGYKTEVSESGPPSRVFACYVNVGQRAVSFTLKFTHEIPDDADETATPQPVVQYNPTSLEYETDETLLSSLEFLSESFHFSPHQLHTFLRSLVDRVQEKTTDGSDSEDDGN